jgi:beta-lactam-binding protein with PASTA domain
MKKIPIKELILYILIGINLLIFILLLILFKNTISSNVESIVPPDVRGKNIIEASKILSEKNFKIVIGGILMDRNKDFLLVLDQNPLTTKVPIGSSITLWINMPAFFAKVPDVRYKDMGEALNILEKAGFVVDFAGNKEGYVVKQVPQANIYMEKGGTVLLYTFTTTSYENIPESSYTSGGE